DVLTKFRLLGAVMVTMGVVEYVTLIWVVPILVALSFATTTMAFGPAVSITVQVNCSPVSDAATPLQVTELIPDVTSRAIPWMLSDANDTVAPSRGEVTVTTGSAPSSPVIVRLKPLLGDPRGSTVRVLSVESFTGFVLTLTLREKS